MFKLLLTICLIDAVSNDELLGAEVMLNELRVADFTGLDRKAVLEDVSESTTLLA